MSMNRAQRKKAEKQKRLEEKRKAIPSVLRAASEAAAATLDVEREPILVAPDDTDVPLAFVGAQIEEAILLDPLLAPPGPFGVLEIADTDLPPATDPEPPAPSTPLDESPAWAARSQLLALKRKIGEAQDLVWRGGSARDRSELLARQGHVLIWEAGTSHDFDALVRGLPRPLTIFLADGVTMPATEISLAGVSIFGGS